ncbi:MAG: HAD-IB family hydrolase [Bifidobacteriaceae bacterium]|jgi:HAD superfamily hydrolase (TIGR01490 family)|nr:HAD-IB family hydrolase [Bifidobacteriaceae bacterium]
MTPTPPASPAAPPQAAFFDLDKTLIARSSTLALTSTLVAEGILRRRTVLRSVYAQAAYQMGSAGQTQSERLRVILGRVIGGWDASRVAALANERIAEKVAPQVFSEAAELIERHRRAGRDIVIVSASSRELVEPIGALLGADHCLATRMQVKDGRYTGEAEFFNYGPAKAVAMAGLAGREGYDLSQSYGYSDSITDLPMLEAVGHAAVVNPSRQLKRLAEERGWEVVRFRAPTSVRLENRRLAWGALAALAAPVALALLAAKFAHWARRRERVGTGV